MNDARSAKSIRQVGSPADLVGPIRKSPRHRAQALPQPVLELVSRIPAHSEDREALRSRREADIQRRLKPTQGCSWPRAKPDHLLLSFALPAPWQTVSRSA